MEKLAMYFQILIFLTLTKVSLGGFFGSLISPFSEQCDGRWVKENIVGLENDLDEHLYGQHIAIDVVLGALSSHKAKPHHKKPLVLNFHGWSGGGKGFVADFILKHWYEKGTKSSFIRQYQAKLHFPLESMVYKYQKQLQSELEETISKCPKAMFVFDEVDKFPPHVLDGIKPYLDYNSHINGHDYREAIFIFITNTGAQDINNIVRAKWLDGVPREGLELRDFENALKSISFNEDGGFFRSDLIKHHLIDYLVPFLPLERQHVELCIQAEWLSQGGNRADLDDVTREVLADMAFASPDELYSTSGCKRVFEKINYIFEQIRRRQYRKKIEF